MKNFLLALFCLPVLVQAQYPWKEVPFSRFQTPPQTYVAAKVKWPLTVDGQLDEAAWKDAPWTVAFADIEGGDKPSPRFKTRAKMLWDEDFLYIAAEMEEPHLWATYDQHDMITFHENDFEVFIDHDGDTHAYFEVEVNARKQIFDLFLARPYRDGGPSLISWDVRDLKVGVALDGTLNDGSDTDKGWTLEMAIPFKSLRFGVEALRPKTGDVWRMNFSRVEWHTTWNGTAYEKVKGTDGKPLHEDNWVWSPQGLVNMHFPERWAYVQFSETAETAFVLPPDEPFRKALREVYYRQHVKMTKTGKFASTISALGVPTTLRHHGKTYRLVLQTTANTFEALFSNPSDKVRYRMNHEGRYEVLKPEEK